MKKNAPNLIHDACGVWRSYRRLFIYWSYRRCRTHFIMYKARRSFADGLELLHLILIFVRCLRVRPCVRIRYVVHRYINFRYVPNFFLRPLLYALGATITSSCSIFRFDYIYWLLQQLTFPVYKRTSARTSNDDRRVHHQSYHWAYFVCSTISIHMYHHRFILARSEWAVRRAYISYGLS